jgi:hypothetical protein
VTVAVSSDIAEVDYITPQLWEVDYITPNLWNGLYHPA